MSSGIKNPVDILICSYKSSYGSHFAKEPSLLSCGHFVCKGCISFKKDVFSIFCNLCNVKNERDLKSKDELPLFHLFMKQNIGQVIEKFQHWLEESVNGFKHKIIDSNERIENQIEYAKGALKIKIESLKLELDKWNEQIATELDELKIQWNNSKFNYTKIYKENNLHELLNNNLEQKISTEKGLYEAQEKLKELRKSIFDFSNFIPKVELNLSELKVKRGLIGEVNYNFGDHDMCIENIEQRVDNGNYEKLDLCQNTLISLCILPNGNLLFVKDNPKCFLLFDSNFKFFKQIEMICNQRVNPLAVETNGIDSIYFTDTSNRIIKTNLNFTEFKFGNNPIQITTHRSKPKTVFRTLHSQTQISLFYGIPLQDTSYNENTLQETSYNGILFHNNELYLCDYTNSRIYILQLPDLATKETLTISCQPKSIKIIKNIACVVSYESTLYFYDVANNFTLLKSFNNTGGLIGSIDLNYFVVYNSRDSTLSYYNTEPNHVKELKIEESKLKITGNFNGTIFKHKHKLLMFLSGWNGIILI